MVTVGSVFSIAVLTVGGCGSGGSGSLGSGGSDAAPGTDSATPGSDSGSQKNDAGRACVTVDPNTFTKDAPCTKDSDCSGIQTGQICDGQCLCGQNLAIGQNEASKYADAIRGIQRGNCDCAAGAPPRCIEQVCTLCALPGPGDGGCNKL